MFACGCREAIGHNEEFLFALAQEEPLRYPELLALWAAFYKSPRLSGRQAGLLVHELIDLLASNGGAGNKALAAPVVRLLPFFSAAYRSDAEIKCNSD
jgi:hypothetical protein